MMLSGWDANQWTQWGFHWHTRLPTTNHPPQPPTHQAPTPLTRLQGQAPQTGPTISTNTNPAQLPTNATNIPANQITPINRQQGLAQQSGQQTTINDSPAQPLINLTSNQETGITPTNREQGLAPQTDHNTINNNNPAQPPTNLTNNRGTRMADRHHIDSSTTAPNNVTTIHQRGTHQPNSNPNQIPNPNQPINPEVGSGQDSYLEPWGDRLQQPKPSNTVRLCLQNFSRWPKTRKHKKTTISAGSLTLQKSTFSSLRKTTWHGTSYIAVTGFMSEPEDGGNHYIYRRPITQQIPTQAHINQGGQESSASTGPPTASTQPARTQLA